MRLILFVCYTNNREDTNVGPPWYNGCSQATLPAPSRGCAAHRFFIFLILFYIFYINVAWGSFFKKKELGRMFCPTIG